MFPILGTQCPMRAPRRQEFPEEVSNCPSMTHKPRRILSLSLSSARMWLEPGAGRCPLRSGPGPVLLAPDPWREGRGRLYNSSSCPVKPGASRRGDKASSPCFSLPGAPRLKQKRWQPPHCSTSYCVCPSFICCVSVLFPPSLHFVR